jgi:hypothetical protein
MLSPVENGSGIWRGRATGLSEDRTEDGRPIREEAAVVDMTALTNSIHLLDGEVIVQRGYCEAITRVDQVTRS